MESYWCEWDLRIAGSTRKRKKIRFRSGQSGVLRRKREKPKGEVKFFYKYKK